MKLLNNLRRVTHITFNIIPPVAVATITGTVSPVPAATITGTVPAATITGTIPAATITGTDAAAGIAASVQHITWFNRPSGRLNHGTALWLEMM